MRILDVVLLKDVRLALDVGCGTGFPTLELAMRLGIGTQVYGLDTQQEVVAATRRKILKDRLNNAFMVCGDAISLPFGNGLFDLVTSNNGINNVRDPQKALTEVGRVCRPGAQFVFTVNTDRTFLEFYETYREVLYELGIEKHIGRLNSQIFEKRKPVSLLEFLVKQAGFRIYSLQEDSFSYRFRNGTSFLDHALIRQAFLESWYDVLPDSDRQSAFGLIESRLNDMAEKKGELKLDVPFVTFDCRKI